MSVAIKEADISEYTVVEVLTAEEIDVEITSSETAEPIAENAGPVIKIEPERYKGDYEVIPKVTEQSLETAEKYMERNVFINGIPKFETTNPAGGTTVYIGSEV